MSNLQISKIVEGLKEVPGALDNGQVLPPKYRKFTLQELDPSKTTVAVYSDNLIDNPEIWRDKKGSIDASVSGHRSGVGEEVGIEALAWYVSFHNNQENWGIYIPISSIHYLNEILEIRVHSTVNLDQISKQVLLNHEIYHFLTDLAVSQFELVTKLGMYRQHKSLYKFKGLNLSSNEQYNELEENLANAFMLEEIKKSVSDNQMRRITAWVETMPQGYRDGAETFYNSQRNFLEKYNLNRYSVLVAVQKQLNIIEPALDLTVLIPKPVENIVAQCPIYILDDAREHGLDEDIVRFFQKMDEIEETKKFKKMLLKTPQQIQTAWKKKKQEFRISLPKPPAFKKYKSLYAAYLPDGFRVHFLKPNKKETTWLAVEIGDHKSMGHG